MPGKIDRFRIERSLGSGAQGTVLLATDEQLSRQVALKLLKLSDIESTDDQLENEARIASQLQHPNLVTLHEVGTYHHLRYLVFEFVDGESLKDRLLREGYLPVDQAVILMSQILAGVAYLHEHGIVHRDLSPANILLTGDGTPKVTDFGVSAWYRDQQRGAKVGGTLPYMSPEPFLDAPLGPHSDVFTLGAIFYELIKGSRLIHWKDRDAIIQKIVSGNNNADIAELECPAIVARVIKKSLQRPVSQRYPSARGMKDELDTYRIPRGETGVPDAAGHSTAEFLLRRMRYKKGFSALSGHINKILELTSTNSGATSDRIANILAKDMTLSQRVLTAANSAVSSDAKITTLPRAIVLLGFEQLRMCVTKALIEQQFDDGSPALHDALIRSFFSAILAKVLAHETGFQRTTDAFTCAMFHDIGRTLTIHYFDEEYAAIVEFAAHRSLDELTASREILGISYHELGAEVARSWKFPDSIINAMRPLPRGDIPPVTDDDARVGFIAAFANALCTAALACDFDEVIDQMGALIRRSEHVWQLTPSVLGSAYEEAAHLTGNYAKLLNVGPEEQISLSLLARPFF